MPSKTAEILEKIKQKRTQKLHISQDYTENTKIIKNNKFLR